jgi:transposase
VLHKMVLDQVRGGRLDDPQRFARSKMVGAHFDLVPCRFQSGKTDYDRRISKCGDAMMRTTL